MRLKLLLWISAIFFIIPFALGAEITVQLDNKTAKLLHDSWTDTNDATNHGSDITNTVFGIATDRIRAWLTWNITPVVEQCSEIIAANVSMQCTAGDDCAITTSSSVYEVFTAAALGAWEEDIITGSNNPCGTSDHDDATFCNQTASDTITVATDGGAFNWSVTAMIKGALSDSLTNVSMNFGNTLVGNQHLFHSKEAVAQNVKPVLYVVCDDGTSPPVDPGLQEFTITGTDAYDASSLTNITVLFDNSTFAFNASTVNGTLIINNNSIPSFNSTYNLTFRVNDSGGYFNVSYPDTNLTQFGSLIGSAFQSLLYINASEVVTENAIIGFRVFSPLKTNLSNSSGFGRLLLNAGSYNISGNGTGNFVATNQISIGVLEEQTITLEMGSSNLTVTANSVISGSAINTFIINLSVPSLEYSQNRSTTTGSLVFPTIPHTYNVSITAAGFASASQTITVTSGNDFPNVTFNLFTENSINITIFDEETIEIINYTETTLIFTHNLSQFTNTTTTGATFIDDLIGGSWDILASTPIHSQRHYFVTITANSHTNLNMYLLNSSNGETKFFNLKNKQDQAITGALVSVSNQINNTFVTVAQKESDFAGQANIFLSSANEYRFTIEAPGFNTKVFDLEPVQTTYNIILTSEDDVEFTTVFSKVSYTILPSSTLLDNSQAQNISIIVSSPEGLVSYFGLNSSFNDEIRITNVSGSVSGGTASININLSNHTGSRVPVDFFIKLSGTDIIQVHRTYFVSSLANVSNYSIDSFAKRYSGNFTNVMKAVIAVGSVTAVIISFAEMGVPPAISGVIGSMGIIAWSIVGWISRTAAFIIALITIGMFMLRRGD